MVLSMWPENIYEDLWMVCWVGVWSIMGGGRWGSGALNGSVRPVKLNNKLQDSFNWSARTPVYGHIKERGWHSTSIVKLYSFEGAGEFLK
jgi:hypothetical protein